MRSQHAEIERPRQAEGPGERPTTLSELETSQVRVDGRTPARQPPTRIGDNSVLDHYQAKQVGLGRTFPATYAHAKRDRPARLSYSIKLMRRRHRSRTPPTFPRCPAGCRSASR